MRILQIHPFMKSEDLFPAAGGMARTALALTRMLAERGHDVRVLPIPEGVGSRVLWEVAPGLSVEVAPAMDFLNRGDARWLAGSLIRLNPPPGSLRNVYYDACALAALRRSWKSFHPDIIHNHLARRPFPRLARALGMGGNLILTHHHGEPGEDLGCYDRIIFPSESTRGEILKVSGYPMEKTRQIYDPVHSAFLRGAVVDGPERSGICYIGAIRRRKGIDLLLEAWRMDERLSREPLIICGAGPDQSLITEAVREGLPVVAKGYLPPQKLAPLLRKARLAVIPSRMETLGVTLLEAMCSGVPVVGWAPTVREMEQALGMPVGIPFDGRQQSARELADAVRAALKSAFCHTPHRRAMAQAARRIFSQDEFVNGYLRVYGEIC